MSVMALIKVVVQKFGLGVLVALHLIYYVASYIYNYLLNSFDEILIYCGANKPIQSINSLVEEVKCFPKVPKHLVLIFQEEDISYNDCVKVVLWCIQSKVPYLSFYSFNNVINPTSLYEVLCKVNKRSLQSVKWGHSFHKSVREMAKKDINGYVWTPLIEVNIFTEKSVNMSIENVMFKLCQEKTNLEDISIDLLDSALREEVPLPDPCCALIFGKCFSTVGFMPWQLRITELIHLPSHHNLRVEDFAKSLRTYAYCQQRFGK